MEEKKRILVVDDDENIREYLSRILEMEGFRTDTAGTARPDSINRWMPVVSWSSPCRSRGVRRKASKMAGVNT